MYESPLVAADRIGQFGALGKYVGPDDHLRITSFNSAAGVTLAIETRFLDVDGHVVAGAERHVPNTDRSVATSLFRLPEGWLLDVLVRATAGAPRVGQCYVVLELVRGFTGAVVPIAFLAQGYVTDTTRFGWPGSPSSSSAAGPGVIRSIAGTNPAANTEISESVPTNARWRLLAIRFSLTTDANAANREVALTIDDGATVYQRIPSRFTHVASLTFGYSAVQNAALEAVAQDTEKLIRLPPIVLQGGHRFNTVTTNRQVGDDYTAPQYTVEEWIED